jgi:hypothetical protein
MAQPQVGHATITVGTSATLLFQAPTGSGQCNLYIDNEGGSKVYLGDETVTVSGDLEGYNLDNGEKLEMMFNGGEQLWGISASSSKVCLLWTI